MAGINSIKLKKGGTTKTVQVGSKAYNNYLSQGYSIVKGTEKNAPKSSSSSKTTTSTPTPTTSTKTTTSSSSGGSSNLTAEQKTAAYNQLEQIKQTLLALQQKAKTATPSTPTSGGGSPSTYQGSSIVDFLNSSGQDSSYAARVKLAQQNGITNYSGTAAQNTQLLNTLRSGSVSSNSGGIPSSVAGSTLSTQDVLDKRKQLEEIKSKALSIQDQLKFLEDASNQDPFQLTPDQNKPINPIQDPDTLLSRYFTDETQLTKAEKERDRLLNQISDTTSDYYKGKENALKDAYNEYGVGDKQENLAKIQKEMADRQVKLRTDIQNLETAPEFRGVSREFANDQREQIKSVGAFDLSNLAIIESAYSGDLERSRSLAQELVDNQFNAFTGQLETYKSQLEALMPQLNADQQKRALAIELALDERSRQLAQAKADTELKYEYATLAAEMNAPINVTRSILNATSADEAFMLAAPYMNEKQAITTTSTGATRGGSTSVGGYTSDATGISPFTGSLAKLDITSSKTTNRDLENAVREQFAPEFSARLFSELTSEQLRDFIAKYDAYQRSLGMNTDPVQALEEYLAYIGKGGSSGGGSSSGGNTSVYDEINSFKF